VLSIGTKIINIGRPWTFLWWHGVGLSTRHTLAQKLITD